MASYDVFISYRREGGSAEARLLQSQLQARHIRAFLDVTELGRGYFDDALLKHIEEIPNFVVVLSPNCLNRAEHDEDWLRREIAHALATDRNVVPLLMPGFQWPPKLPKELRNLPRHNGMDYSHLYFDAMMQKLVATLVLPAAETEEQRKERPSQQQLEQTRLERALLEEERQKLERARQSSERMREETEARRQSLELRQAEDAKRREEERRAHKGDAPTERWSSRVLSGDLSASPALQQAALTADWAAVLLSLAFLGSSTSGTDAQAGFAFGVFFLALSLWVRVNPRQAATLGLVTCGLGAIGMIGVTVSRNFDGGRVCLALLAATATVAFWRLSREIRSPAAPPSAAESRAAPVPFGLRFGELIGVAGPKLEMRRLRLYFVARLAAGLAYSWALAGNQSFLSSYRVNYLYVIWGAAALPLALTATFRWLRNPLLSLGTAAVIAGLVNPSFWQGQAAMLVLVQELVGVLLLAWAIGEIEFTSAAIWFGAAAASFATLVLQWLWGFRASGWFQAGPNFTRVFLFAFVFSVVFAGGTAYSNKPKGA